MATQQDIANHLQALREREINFRELVKILKAADMPVGQGWEGLLPKYNALPADVDLADYLNVLKTVYTNHYLYSNRAVVVLKFRAGEVATLARRANSWVDAASPFIGSFPLPVSESVLARLPSIPVATQLLVDDGTGDKTLVSCSKRYVRSRVPIDLSQLTKTARGALEGYDEIFGIRSRFIQAFDTWMVDAAHDVVIISIDLCGNLSLDDIGRSVVKHLDDFALKIAPLHLSSERVNFFPKIAKLYSEVDGGVERVGHVTSSGSNKVERMRSRGDDLRLEPFHRDGLVAIGGSTDLFSICKRWPVGDYHIGATIPGHFAQINEQSPVTGTAMIEGCRSKEDFLFVLDKLG